MSLRQAFNILWNDPRTLTQAMIASLMAASFSAFMPVFETEPDQTFSCRTRFGEAAIFHDDKKGRTLTMVKADGALVYESNRVHSFSQLKELAEDFCGGTTPPIRAEYVNDGPATPFYMCVSHNDLKAAVLVESPSYVRVLRGGGGRVNEAKLLRGHLENGMYYAREYCLGNTLKLP